MYSTSSRRGSAPVEAAATDRSGARWSLVSEADEEDNKPDEHVEFIRSVRSFQCVLLRQFRNAPSSVASPRGAAVLELYRRDERGKGVMSARGPATPSAAAGEGEEPYLARFAQPFPVRPVWAALPRPSLPGLDDEVPGGEAWASDYSSAPQVCVVLQGALKMRAAVHSALCKLAKHPVGMLVSVNPEVPEAGDDGKLLLFAVVGLRAPRGQEASTSQKPRRTLLSPGRSGREGGRSPASPRSRAYEEDDILSVAEQRQMVWAAVHEALWDADKALPEVVEEIFMLQDVWLYDRLFRWVALRQQKTAWKEPLQTLSQEELDVIVHQFGEETATHFLFVEQYTRYLRAAAVVALSCLAVSHLAKTGVFGDAPSLERGPWTVLAAFLPAWGFHFLASWRAVASKAGFRWLGSLGSVQNSVKEVARLQSVESDAEKRRRYCWVTLLTVPLMGVQLCVVLGVTVTFVTIEVCLYDVVWETIGLLWQLVAIAIYNLAFGVAFMLILGLFHPVSNIVTQWEGHPDLDLRKWHLTAKVYANWFFAVFFYFFVIAFVYVPFGENLAGLFVPGAGHEDERALGEASLFTNSTARHKEATKDIIRHALLEFRPETDRLTTDVLLFFVLQDAMRLSQVLLPVARALWGMGRFHGRSDGGHAPQRHKRTAVVSGLLGMLRVCLKSRDDGHNSGDEDFGLRRRWRRENTSEASGESSEDDDEILDSARSQDRLMESSRQRARSSASSRPSTVRPRLSTTESRLSYNVDVPPGQSRFSALKGLPSRVPATPATRRSAFRGQQTLPPLAAGQGCLVAYILVDQVRISRPAEHPKADKREEVVMLACSLEAPKGLPQTIPAVTSRLRNCYASDRKPRTLEEDPDEDLGDLFTLACEAALADGSNHGAVRLSLLVEILEPEAFPGSGSSAASSGVEPNSWASIVELPLDGGDSFGSGSSGQRPRLGMGALMAKTGVAELGPVTVEYVAGLVRAPTHYEALERVPRALRRAREGLSPEDPAEEPTPEDMAYEEARALSSDPDLPQARKPGRLPWVWWDEELAGLYWEEVFELFAVKETFETFEIYAHLATSFSYVCLFGISAPICPLLALIFTSVEVRQDQLRLLWLSRPPHPDEETLRFKRRVSLGAWYEILRFTCHLSVVVNLLLWGLTYEGLSSTKPANWSSEDWWRALALFLLIERGAVQLSKLLFSYYSQLDHETASAYLRRYVRLRRAFVNDDDDEVSKLEHRSSRQLRHEDCRRRMTRIPSKGLSSLL